MKLILCVVFALLSSSVVVALEEGKCAGKEALFPAGAVLADGLCAQIYRQTSDLINTESRPRSLFVTPANEVFGLERAGFYEEWESLVGYVMVYDDEENDGTAESGTVLANMTSLDHGLAVTDTHFYATNAYGVYRWPYTMGDRTFKSNDEENMEVIVQDIPSPSNQLHPTRTILIDDETATDSELWLYLATGSEQNIDMNSDRANIRRYNLLNLPAQGGYNWTDGQVVASGVRNTVGMGMDKFNILWGVDNGMDGPYRQDLGGNINEGNPADELNRFPPELYGASYGYPYCFTEYTLPDGVGMGRGTQWVLGNFTGNFTDEYCRDPAYNIPPVVALQDHSAPLSITFYNHQEEWPENCPQGVALPKEWDGHAFITYHGSYYREEPIGAKVMRIPMTEDGQVDGGIDLEPLVVMEDADNGPEWLSGIRPVDVKFDACGRLLVSSDGSYEDQDGRMIILIQSQVQTNSTSASTSSAPVAVKNLSVLIASTLCAFLLFL